VEIVSVTLVVGSTFTVSPTHTVTLSQVALTVEGDLVLEENSRLELECSGDGCKVDGSDC